VTPSQCARDLPSDFNYDDMDNDPDYEADSESDNIEENGNVV